MWPGVHGGVTPGEPPSLAGTGVSDQGREEAQVQWWDDALWSERVSTAHLWTNIAQVGFYPP